MVLTELLAALEWLRLFNEMSVAILALLNTLPVGNLQPSDVIPDEWDGTVGAVPTDIKIRAGEIAIEKVLAAKALAAPDAGPERSK